MPEPTLISEAQLQASIIAAARELSWWVADSRDRRKSEPSLPDLILVHPVQHRLVFMEVKSATGRLRPGTWTRAGRYMPGQREWLDALGTCPEVETYLIRPADLDWVYQMLVEKPEIERVVE